MKNSISYLLVSLWALCGCTLEPVKLDQSSIRIEKRVDIGSHIGSDNTIDWINSRSSDDFIIVDITSKENLIEMSKKHSILIGVSSYFCGTPKSVAPIDTGSLYIYDQPLHVAKFNNEQPVLTNGEYRYKIVLFISFEKDIELQEAFRHDKKQTHYQKFNLRENPQDICIYVMSAGFMTPSHKSNIVKLKKEDIAKAIKGE